MLKPLVKFAIKFNIYEKNNISFGISDLRGFTYIMCKKDSSSVFYG